MDIDFILSPNFRVGRAGKKPIAFVFHTTEGDFDGALAWCLDPKSKVSYHYIIKKNGDVVQLVEDENTAWHAGKMKDATPYGELYAPNPNLLTLGLAFAGFASQGPNFEQMVALARLVKQLAAIHSIPLDRKHLLLHYDIRTDKVCPGPNFNLDALIFLAQLN